MMCKNRFSAVLIFLFSFLMLFLNTSVIAGNGKISGKVTDSSSGEPLPGASVFIKGSTIGTLSDIEGKYQLLQVPEGTQTLIISYVGYKKREIVVTVKAGQSLPIDIVLQYDAINMNEVKVTAQLEGQSAAINQQLSSNTIVNVVSKDKLQELPDQNAAESLGRLPGISIQRNNGEGQKVVVRGLSPRFSAITVNGVQLPATSQPGDFSTDGSGATDDRSVDLSMISPDVLEGIEVFKALRPDLDGDAIGGTVNFTTKKAREGAKTSIRMFGGYNKLQSDYGNYRGSVSYSNRFFGSEEGKSKLGILINGNIQRANRASDAVGGQYSWVGEVDNNPVYTTSDVTLTKHNEIRNRYGLNLAMDYELSENHNIFFNSLWAGTHQDEKNQTHDYAIAASGGHYRNYFERNVDMNTWSNSLSGKHIFGITEVDWTLSYAISKENTPWAAYVQFEETSAYANTMPVNNLSPNQVPLYALNNAAAAGLSSSYIQTEDVTDKNKTAELSVKHPFFVGEDIAGYIKLGGKIRYKDRDKNVDQWGGLRWFTGQKVMSAFPGLYVSATNSASDISLINFISSTKTLDNFLSGEYPFIETLDESKLHTFLDNYQNIYKQTRNYKIDVEDYLASEDVNSLYLMTEINWKNIITLMPGFRYERTTTDYKTNVINPNTTSLILKTALNDTSGSRSYGNFLPMVQLKIKPVEWMDLRFAATKSLSRPNYLSLIPYEMVDVENLYLRYGNPNLKETRANNYDIYLSVHDNKFGLFTIGKFYKQLYDIDYMRTKKITTAVYYASYLPSLKGFTVVYPDNLPGETTVDGWEFELQTNLNFLPSPFDGILLYANYSLVYSETSYPFSVYKTTYLTHAPWVQTTATDTSRTGRMIGQPNQIANLTIGYEKKGFSARLSMIYQGDALRNVATSEAADELDKASVRWDLVLQQRIGENLSVIWQMNNITNQQERTYIRYKDYTTRTQEFGMTMDFGVQYKF
jgi:TonB-dependent receptor